MSDSNTNHAAENKPEGTPEVKPTKPAKKGKADKPAKAEKAQTPVVPAPEALKEAPSMCAVLRWIGANVDAKPSLVMAHAKELGIKPALPTIQRQLLLGRKNRMPVPELPKAEQKRIEKILAHKGSEAV